MWEPREHLPGPSQNVSKGRAIGNGNKILVLPPNPSFFVLALGFSLSWGNI